MATVKKKKKSAAATVTKVPSAKLPLMTAVLPAMYDGSLTDLLMLLAATTKVTIIDADMPPAAAMDITVNKCPTYMLSRHQDRVLTITANDVMLASASEPCKMLVFSANRWAYFIALKAIIDKEAKELKC